MGKICKNCKYWSVPDSSYDFYAGRCSNKLFIYLGGMSKTPENGLGYEDYEGYSAVFYTGPKFGCVHFEVSQ